MLGVDSGGVVSWRAAGGREMGRGLAAGEECRCWEYIREEKWLDNLLQDWSW